MKKFIRVRMHQKYDFLTSGRHAMPVRSKIIKFARSVGPRTRREYTDKKFQQFFIIFICFIFFPKKKSVFYFGKPKTMAVCCRPRYAGQTRTEKDRNKLFK